MALLEALDTLPEELQDAYGDVQDDFCRRYECSVFDATGDDGMMSFGDACRLLRDHGCAWSDYTGEGNASRHPAHLLSFLGY